MTTPSDDPRRWSYMLSLAELLENGTPGDPDASKRLHECLESFEQVLDSPDPLEDFAGFALSRFCRAARRSLER